MSIESKLEEGIAVLSRLPPNTTDKMLARDLKADKDMLKLLKRAGLIDADTVFFQIWRTEAGLNRQINSGDFKSKPKVILHKADLPKPDKKSTQKKPKKKKLKETKPVPITKTAYKKSFEELQERLAAIRRGDAPKAAPKKIAKAKFQYTDDDCVTLHNIGKRGRPSKFTRYQAELLIEFKSKLGSLLSEDS